MPEVPAKPRSEVIVYTADFLQGFQEVRDMRAGRRHTAGRAARC